MATSIPEQKFPSVMIVPKNDHDIDVLVTGSSGDMVITVHHDGPTVMMHALGGDPVAARNLTAAWSLKANGRLRGWLARRDNHLEFFPVRKKRAKKRAPKKHNTKT